MAEIHLQASSMSASEHTERVNFLPCHVDYDGSAKVAEYFDSATTNEANYMTSTFRGRPVLGQKVHLPAGYTGAVVTEKRRAASDQQVRNIQVTQTFQTLTNWNLDAKPSLSDGVRMAMQWIDIADVIHSPIDNDNEKENSPTDR